MYRTSPETQGPKREVGGEDCGSVGLLGWGNVFRSVTQIIFMSRMYSVY